MKQKIKDIVQEFKKVQWPSWDALQNDAIVVAIASIIIALIIYVMDQSFNTILGWFYSIF
jgi:preprotein translocase subunit SecE